MIRGDSAASTQSSFMREINMYSEGHRLTRTPRCINHGRAYTGQVLWGRLSSNPTGALWRSMAASASAPFAGQMS